MKRVTVVSFVAVAIFAGVLLAQQAGSGGRQSIMDRIGSLNEKQLQRALERFPDADLNKDGTLTREEALAFAKEALKAQKPEATRTPATGGKVRAPDLVDVRYGSHERNVLDLWKAKGDGPRPLVVFIHGGGFTSGDKSKYRNDLQLARLVESGVSCAAINYPFRQDAAIQDILHHCARAVQFLRFHATEWNIDKKRVGAWGGSAGAGTSLWLDTRDDLADPSNPDPVLRESSRVQVAVLNSTQATYDLTRWETFLGPAHPEWWRTPDEPAEFYHLKTLDELKAPANKAILRECDMLGWITRDDAPLFISNPQADGPVKDRGHYLHHPAHAREVEKECKAAGVPCVWLQDGVEGAKPDPVDFVLAQLNARPKPDSSAEAGQ